MAESSELSPLQDSLLRALQCIDKQISREMQRTPEEREEHGVQKWEPIQKRVESVTAFVLDCIGDQVADLDSVLVLSQAFAKVLQMYVDDVGIEGLGKVRSGYCHHALESVARDANRGMKVLQGTTELM